MEYRLASKEELERIWDFNIAENSGDERWVDWKKEYIGYNLNGEAFTFLVLDADVPIGEGTLILSPACNTIKWSYFQTDAGNRMLCKES